MKLAKLKYSLIPALSLCVLALTSCSESYPSLEYEDDKDVIKNDEASDKTPIMLFVQKPSLFSITTRGTGAFDPNESNFEAKRQNMLLHIFAFHNTPDVNMAESMNSVHGGASEPDYENCLIDNGVNSGNLYWMGRPARLNSDNEGVEILKDKVTKEPEQLYYSSVHQDYGYNFFAYYIDDFEPNASNTTRTRNEIYHNIDIDGSQDIMCGYSPKLQIGNVMDDLGYNVRKDGKISESIAQEMYDNILSDTEKSNINNILSYGYSTYSAHRGINPTINVKHQLARLKFTAYPGDARSENITITGIEVETRTQGKLTVAATDLSKVGLTFREDQPLSSIYLREKSVDGIEKNQPLREDYYNIVLTEEDKKRPNSEWYLRTATPIGDCLLVPAGDNIIRMTLHYKEKYKISENGDEYGVRYPHVIYNVKAPVKPQNKDEATGNYTFKAGYSYDIMIAVYGLQPIEIAAQMEGWKEGGNVDLGEDDFFDVPLE